MRKFLLFFVVFFVGLGVRVNADDSDNVPDLKIYQKIENQIIKETTKNLITLCFEMTDNFKELHKEICDDYNKIVSNFDDDSVYKTIFSSLKTSLQHHIELADNFGIDAEISDAYMVKFNKLMFYMDTAILCEAVKYSYPNCEISVDCTNILKVDDMEYLKSFNLALQSCKEN